MTIMQRVIRCGLSMDRLKEGRGEMKAVDVLKDALTSDPGRARELIARSVESENVTNEEADELVRLAIKLGAIKREDLL